MDVNGALDHGTLFLALASLLFFASLFGLVANWLKQPLIIAFIAVGLLAGPGALNLFPDSSALGLLSEVGISILLFAVGLKLDLTVIKTMGPVALATGLGQVAFTSIIGFFICLGLGFEVEASIYIAVALTFSSTIIIVKLLSDKKEIDALHGRIAVGFLIVQDILVVLAMIALSAMGTAGEVTNSSSLGLQAAFVGLKGLVFTAGILAIGRWVLPKALEIIAQKPELLTLFAVCWAVIAAALSDSLGLSQEVGAFIAGISMASSHFRESVASRLVSLRDFLLLFFFVHLGSGLDLSHLTTQIVPATLLSLFVLIGNPLIVMVIMGFMGYRKRTGFLAGLTVAQISEFSFILAALGARLGHVSEETVGLITVVGLITIGVSTYLIIYSQPIYEKIAPFLSLFERANATAEDKLANGQDSEPYEYLVLGTGRMGQQVFQCFEKNYIRYMGVDFDPYVVSQLREQKKPVIYGDLSDPELLQNLTHDKVKAVISTVPDALNNRGLIRALKEIDFKGQVAVTVAYPHQIEEFKELGADEVFCPPIDMGMYAAEKILGKRYLASL